MDIRTPFLFTVVLQFRFAYAQSMALLSSDDIVQLSPAEKLELVEQLWDSLEQDQIPLTEAQKVEIERR